MKMSTSPKYRTYAITCWPLVNCIISQRLLLSCSTHAVDAVAAHRCHELWSYTQVAEWQIKWHNPPDLVLKSLMATCLALWNLDWCVV